MAMRSDSSAKRSTRAATLTLEDGTVLHGYSFGADVSVAGEVVFSTGMVGYAESLTDPSYKGQMLTLTYPMIGNYGVPDRSLRDEYGLAKHFESDKIHASALLVQDYSHHYSHWEATSSLGDWLREEGIPAIGGIDTRHLTKKIRDKGAMLGKLEVEGGGEVASFSDPNKRNLVAEVSITEPRVYGKGNPIKVLAVDCGVKNNIIRLLCKKGAEVTLVPWDYDLSADAHEFDGIFLSNGPGDPTMCVSTVKQMEKIIALEGDDIKPIFGICMGNQLVGLAAGCTAEKLPFGNRGQNQPVVNRLTNECYITPQNHGYAIDDTKLGQGWQPLFTNVNDGTNEGVRHQTKPFFSAQFHPEAQGGPTDTEFLFDVFLEAAKTGHRGAIDFPKRGAPPAKPDIKKALMLGSGGLSIGQAGEFDYSGSQAIKALKEEGIEVILMNPNIASVQTNTDNKSPHKADQVFFLPVTPEFVEHVIKREKPDGIVVSMGGQTALNCAVQLHEAGILEKYNVKVLGTPVQAIMATEDRDVFNQKLMEIGEKVAPSEAVVGLEAAVVAAKKIGFPVMIRSAYALGGLGSGICDTEEALRDMGSKALSLSNQILVEKSLRGWKEVEYEVVRDSVNNCITVCNMENFDPLGVHTGDSIVVAPSQTLSNTEYHMLRQTALKVVRHLGIVGECNIQYALDPHSLDYCIIEVNARLSRSSALASKATGYPLAFVAAKLGMGITLPDIENAITKRTMACFEPSLDYCVTKIPRWDLSKFEGVSSNIGSAMSSVGEVMAIGRTWEESMQKALRMTDPSAIDGFQPHGRIRTMPEMLKVLDKPTDLRVYTIAQVMAEGSMTVDEIHDLSKIDHWFLRRLERITNFSKKIEGSELASFSREDMLEAKQLGYSDIQISQRVGATGDEVREARTRFGVTPSVKQVDTLAAEYPAQTNYLYMTYHGDEDDVESDGGGVMVLGSGTYRIGSSVEFDWCGVSAIRTLRNMGFRSTMVNYNPETVSTDYDECDQLYFEELSEERVLDIYNKESHKGVVVSVGGQIPNNLAMHLHKGGANILGTTPDMIDNAEDRNKFSAMIDDMGLQQAAWKELTTTESALDFATEGDALGYPVLIRPSYVLSGAAMNVAYTKEQLLRCLDQAADVSQDHPVVVSKFISGAREIEMDGVGLNGEVVAAATHVHVENAGVHSGDATLILPAGPEDVTPYMFKRDATKAVAKRLNITGPFNMQFIAKGTDCMVIECNLRASRSFPFVSKTMGVDFIEIATKVMTGKSVEDMNAPKLYETGRPHGYVACKAPMFSFTRLRGADPVLGVEMASTGEVACFGVNKEEAFLKALLSTGFKLPAKNILLSVQESMHDDMVHLAHDLHELGYHIHATDGTYDSLKDKGVPATLLQFPGGQREGPTVIEHIRSKKIDLVINLPTAESKRLVDNYHVRRTAVDHGIPLLTNLNVVKLFTSSLMYNKKQKLVGLDPDSLFDYYAREKPEEAWTHEKEFH
ncbi:unnamed protein product [Ectocarpus sp. CCAP 1310/34]|nr:unnamed protein product [Ectocarpus sp. CCAP 1310/34]